MIDSTATIGPPGRIGGIDALPVIDQPTHRSGALLDHLARRMRVAGESVLAGVGLRPRHLIALTLLRDHGESSQTALADLLQMDRTNLVGLLNELETDGLVERRRSAEDRRRHDVALTEAGSHKLATAEFALAAVEDEVLAALDAGEREALYALLQRATAGHVGDCASRGPC